MKNGENKRRCPYLKEVVMVFCEAYPVKKMVPLDRSKTASQCFGDDYHSCALFAEIDSQLAAADGGSLLPPRPRRRQKGVPKDAA